MGGTRGRVAGAVSVIAALLAGCGPVSGEVSGADTARDIAGAAARELNENLGRRERARDAEYIAATEIDAGSVGTPADGTQITVTPVAWSGRVYADETATIDVRFDVSVPDPLPESISPSGEPAGRASVCYRYTLELYEYTRAESIDCPQGVPAVPSPSPLLTLPPDAEDRLAAVLRTATPQTLETAVRAAFPQQGFGVDTVVDDGALVAAVSVAQERDCLVMVSRPGEAPKSVGYDPVQLEPGEIGCTTALYTRPVR